MVYDVLTAFAGKIEALGLPSQCWVWVACSDAGSPAFWNEADTKVRPRRWAYELMVGSVPPKHVASAACRNRRCCNPLHVVLATRGQIVVWNPNTVIWQRHRKTECIRGHSLTDPANVYIHPQRGTRHCRSCARLRDQQRQIGVERHVGWQDTGPRRKQRWQRVGG